MNLNELASKIKQHHEEAITTARRSLDHAKEAGKLLLDAKAQLDHGKWLPWLKEIGVKDRTARLYIQCAKSATLADFRTITDYVAAVRKAKRQDIKDHREQRRAEAIQAAAPHEQYAIHHADCRQFNWPKGIGLIATDPPWADLDAYRWLATFAADHLRNGGLLMVQCGNSGLAEVVPILSAKLQYLWTCAIVFHSPRAMNTNMRIAQAWRPVLMFTQGKWGVDGLHRQRDTVSDTITVSDNQPKDLHVWQQPLSPWIHWVRAWTRDGDLVCDPFTGSGTIAAATKEAGGDRRFVGCEIDADHAKVAQGRIAMLELKEAA